MRTIARCAAALTLFAGSAQATWSIVAVNTRTGEVAVASATCVPGEDLREFVPAIVVGKGAGAAQSWVDPAARNRMLMWQGFQQGWTSDQIFDNLVVNGPPALNTRQFGIVSMNGDPVTFTGSSAGAAALGVVGEIGTIKYAIQGNVLTGDSVILEAEIAFRASRGDLSERVMAAMDAARLQGGDGRCSCEGTNPTGCGAPPPSWVRTCYVAFIIVARIGDQDGICGPLGCANGNYYLNRSRATKRVDPMVSLIDAYEKWRNSQRGQPDHILSQVSASAESAPADGLTRVDYTVRLIDLDGVPLQTGGHNVIVSGEVGGMASFSAVTDNADGTYAFSVTAGTQVGTEQLRITVDDGTRAATLYPFPELQLDPVDRLHAGRSSVAVGSGGSVPFVLQDATLAGRPYLLLASASGTVPGQSWGSLNVPLNSDPVFLATINGANGPLLPSSFGVLDSSGRAQAHFVAPPGLLMTQVGSHFDWAAVFPGPVDAVSNVVGFDLVP